jgi:outer membrane protein TolC
MLKRIAVITAAIIIPLLSFAQADTVQFNLSEAKEYALTHNKNLQQSKMDVRIAEQNYIDSRSTGLPQVSGKVDYMTNFNYEAELNFGGGGGGQEPPDIDYTLLDAGDLEVISMIEQMFGSSSENNTIVMRDQSSATLQVTQLLFNAQYYIGLQMSKTAQTISQMNVSVSELNVKEQVSNTYYLILITEEMLKIIEKNEDSMKELLKLTEDMYNAGMVELTDVDQIRMTLSQLKNSKKQTERSLQLNYTMFSFVTGLESTKKIVLTDDLESLLNSIEEEEKALQAEFDLAQNPNYKMLEAQADVGKQKVSLNEWANAPTLSAFYSYTEKFMTTDFDLTPKHAAGLTLSIPIFSGGSRYAQTNIAKIELDKINTSKQLLEEQLRLENKQLSFEYANAYDNYLTQKENVKTAKRMYNNIHNKYKQGLISGLELTQANTNYLQAENNYITAALSLLQAKLKLNKLYNNL